MWLAVTRRFQSFHSSLELTQETITDNTSRVIRIGNALEVAYNGHGTQTPPVFLVGSWGKKTQVRPSNDIDVMAVFDWKVYTRIESRTGNKQSQLLQEVRSHLVDTYPQTDIRGDGQVVMINFNDITVEIVPVFKFDEGTYLMPDTNDGGSWKIVHPQAQIDYIERTDATYNGNARPLIKMIKMWKRHHNLELKSFLIELLVCEFLATYPHAYEGYFYFDWFVRDFFTFLRTRSGGKVAIPGVKDVVELGSDWSYRAEQAIGDAERACMWERADYDVTAGQEWQKIFGPRIPTKIFST